MGKEEASKLRADFDDPDSMDAIALFFDSSDGATIIY